MNFLTDKLWPNFVTQINTSPKRSVIYSGLTNPVQIFSKSTTSNPNRKITIAVICLVVTLLVLVAIVLILIVFKRSPSNKNNPSSNTSKSYKLPTTEPSIDINQMTSTLRSTETNTTTQPSLDNQSEAKVQTTIDFVTP